jgi:hypothetical protein
MGGEFSKESSRLDEVDKRLAEAKAMAASLCATAASNAARAAPAAAPAPAPAPAPAAPGSNRAWFDAAQEYYQQLIDEKIAIYARMGEHGPVQRVPRGQVRRHGCLFGVAAWAAFLKCLPAFSSNALIRPMWPVWAVTRAFRHRPGCVWPQLLLLQTEALPVCELDCMHVFFRQYTLSRHSIIAMEFPLTTTMPISFFSVLLICSTP